VSCPAQQGLGAPAPCWGLRRAWRAAACRREITTSTSHLVSHLEPQFLPGRECESAGLALKVFAKSCRSCGLPKNSHVGLVLPARHKLPASRAPHHGGRAVPHASAAPCASPMHNLADMRAVLPRCAVPAVPLLQTASGSSCTLSAPGCCCSIMVPTRPARPPSQPRQAGGEGAMARMCRMKLC
jgi:hypothetical protein